MLFGPRFSSASTVERTEFRPLQEGRRGSRDFYSIIAKLHNFPIIAGRALGAIKYIKLGADELAFVLDSSLLQPARCKGYSGVFAAGRLRYMSLSRVGGKGTERHQYAGYTATTVIGIQGPENGHIWTERLTTCRAASASAPSIHHFRIGVPPICVASPEPPSRSCAHHFILVDADIYHKGVPGAYNCGVDSCGCILVCELQASRCATVSRRTIWIFMAMP